MDLVNIPEELQLLIEQKMFKAFNVFFILIFLSSCSGENSKSLTEFSRQNPITDSAETSDSNTVVGQTIFLKPQDKGYPVRYRVKDGKIVYQYKGIQNGVEEVYFTDYGMTEIKFTNTTRETPFRDGVEKISMITLMRDSAIYVIDRTTMNAQKVDNSMLFEVAQRSPTLDLDEAARLTYQSSGGEMRGIDTVLGLPAEKWYMPQQKQQEWRWNGMMLKTLVEVGNSYIRLLATEIDTVSPLPEGIFELPTNVNVTGGISLKQWLSDLNKPIKKRQVFQRDGTPK